MVVHAAFLVSFSFVFVPRCRSVWLGWEKSQEKSNFLAAAGRSVKAPVFKKIGSPSSDKTSFFATGRPPQILSYNVLVYPRQSRLAGVSGKVMVEVFISEKGIPQKSELVGSSGFPDLDEAALKQSLRWQYLPAFLDGVPVASRLRIPVRFVLESR
jgi:TonB family protein